MSTAATGAAQQRITGFARVWRALKQLFYEVVGAIFAVLALTWIGAAVRSWNRDAAHWLIVLAVAVAILFVFFAITSFRRAQKL